MLVPTRGRPHNVQRLLDTWESTVDTRVNTDVLFLVDADDPVIDEYRAIDARYVVFETWQPMVYKVDAAAVKLASSYYALGFMGDDHVPRTPGWNAMMTAQLRTQRAGIVYGDDRLMGGRLPTHWLMTSNIVTALKRMIPASVEHMYCDNSILDLGRGARCITYLSNVVIEHMHPLAGKASSDAGYKRVNASEQFRRDHRSYVIWRRRQYRHDIEVVYSLNRGRTHASRV